MNESKSKVMRCAGEAGARLNVKLNGVELEEIVF